MLEAEILGKGSRDRALVRCSGPKPPNSDPRQGCEGGLRGGLQVNSRCRCGRCGARDICRNGDAATSLSERTSVSGATSKEVLDNSATLSIRGGTFRAREATRAHRPSCEGGPPTGRGRSAANLRSPPNLIGCPQVLVGDVIGIIFAGSRVRSMLRARAARFKRRTTFAETRVLSARTANEPARRAAGLLGGHEVEPSEAAGGAGDHGEDVALRGAVEKRRALPAVALLRCGAARLRWGGGAVRR